MPSFDTNNGQQSPPPSTTKHCLLPCMESLTIDKILKLRREGFGAGRGGQQSPQRSYKWKQSAEGGTIASLHKPLRRRQLLRSPTETAHTNAVLHASRSQRLHPGLPPGGQHMPLCILSRTIFPALTTSYESCKDSTSHGDDQKRKWFGQLFTIPNYYHKAGTLRNAAYTE